MELLNGAKIDIEYDPTTKRYTAWVKVDPYQKSITATAATAAQALGMAIILQAGYTEKTLDAALQAVAK